MTIEAAKLRENAQGAAALGDNLRERAQFWRGLNRMALCRAYFTAAIDAGNLSEALGALAEKEEAENVKTAKA